MKFPPEMIRTAFLLGVIGSSSLVGNASVLGGVPSGEIKITASDAGEYDWFGQAVAIDDGVALVGAPRKAAAYVYDAIDGAELLRLSPSSPRVYEDFGRSVAVSGNRAIVGSPFNGTEYSGAAYIFDVNTGQELWRLTASDDTGQNNFGYSVAIAGDRAIVGAYHKSSGISAGAAYIYDVETGNELFKLTASDVVRGDLFGFSVGIDGDRAIVSSHFDGDAGRHSGAAYVFDVGTGGELFKLTSSDASAGDLFGYSVAMSGDTAIVGALRDNTTRNETGSAYLFDVATGDELFKLTGSSPEEEDFLGYSVAIDGDLAVVGQASLGYIGRVPRQGAAHVFSVATGEELTVLSASDGEAPDEFSAAVSIDGETVVAGAYRDGDSGRYSGSAYLYHLSIIPEPSSLLLSFVLAGALAARTRLRALY